MPNCFKCGADNGEGTKYCTGCGAVLPQMAPQGSPGTSSTLDLDEETEYLSPTSRYANEELSALAWAAHDFLVEDGELDPFLDSYEAVKKHFDNFKAEHMPAMEELIHNQRVDYPEDPYPKQMNYLFRKGSAFYEEGLALVDAYLAALDSPDGADDEMLKRGVNRILDGNDHYCLSLQLIHVRTAAVQDAMKNAALAPPEAPAEGEEEDSEKVPAGNVEEEGEKEEEAADE